MYAIIESGGKQFRVEENDVIDVELLNASEPKVQFDKILFFHDGSQTKIGLPHVANCVVEGEILDTVKGPKVIAYKYKKRKQCRKKTGHRQKYTRVKITKVSLS